MKKFKEVEVIEMVPVSIHCDVCKKEITDYMEVQEMFSYTMFCGYNSVFGDGNQISFDICQHCMKKIIEKFDINVNYEPIDDNQ